MRILMVSPSCPVPADTGGRLRIYHALRCLSASDDVMLCTLYESGAQREHLERLGEELKVRVAAVRQRRSLAYAVPVGLLTGTPTHVVRYRSRALERVVAAEVAMGRFDLLYGHLLWVAPNIPRVGIPMVLDLQNLDDDHWWEAARDARDPVTRGVAVANARAWGRVQHRELPRFQALLSPSPDEQRTLQSRVGPELPVWLVPNGVPGHDEEPGTDRGRRGLDVLFCSSVHVRMNEEAALWMAREVWPLVRERLPDATLWLVGGRPRRPIRALDGQAGIRVTGWVADVRPYYRQAAVAVVPLRRGGGTKLKTLEAMDLGVPCVSTSVGVQGLDVQPGVHVMVADRADEFAGQVAALLTDATAGIRLARAARELVGRRYRWDAIYRVVRSRLHTLLDSGAAGVAGGSIGNHGQA